MPKFVRIVAVSLLFAFAMQAPAFAEVCDKAVGESWLPAHGPVWLLNPIGTGWFTLALQTALLIVAFVFQRRTVAYAVGIFFFATAMLPLFADVLPSHGIYLGQLKEGCRSVRTDLLDFALRIFAAGACIMLIAFRRRTTLA